MYVDKIFTLIRDTQEYFNREYLYKLLFLVPCPVTMAYGDKKKIKGGTLHVYIYTRQVTI